jgi:hypothetical protein
MVDQAVIGALYLRFVEDIPSPQRSSASWQDFAAEHAHTPITFNADVYMELVQEYIVLQQSYNDLQQSNVLEQQLAGSLQVITVCQSATCSICTSMHEAAH